jgi:hypothetical protein
MFWIAVWGLPLLFILEFELITHFGYSAFDSFPGFILAAIVMCGATAFMTFRSVEYVGFRSDAGIPLLYIAKSGPDESRFEVFIGKIIELAAAARNRA